MCIQLLALDEALGGFFRSLDATGIDYLVMLTADHGGTTYPSVTATMPPAMRCGSTRRSTPGNDGQDRSPRKLKLPGDCSTATARSATCISTAS